MADNIECLILEQFQAMRNQIEGLQTEMRSEFSDVKHRINSLNRRLPRLDAIKPEQARILQGSIQH